MKQYSILMILAVSLFAFSCGDDDSNEPAVKCLKCAGEDKVCVGDTQTDPDTGETITITLEFLELALGITNAFDPGACVLE